jgi:hypothetical protein
MSTMLDFKILTLHILDVDKLSADKLNVDNLDFDISDVDKKLCSDIHLSEHLNSFFPAQQQTNTWTKA